eukprot:TRINITY_DN30343_c0_g1_i2.p1 TRINITY_DN30343_c0_g1~~TRINITY_DN30343_c0_g1_i2.p1  ORF type:complete len:424 (-),score=10.57 TRINITY_DN30343_c0_g1_i2:449-1684(-)
MSLLIQYLNQFQRAIQSRDGNTIGNLLRVDNAIMIQGISEVGGNESTIQIHINSKISDELWHEVIKCQLLSVHALHHGKWEAGYKYAESVSKNFREIFINEDGDWIVKPLQQILSNVAMIAWETHNSTQKLMGQEQSTVLEQCQSELRMALSKCQKSKSESKQRSMLFIANILLKFYFKSNNVGLCKHVLGVVGLSRQFERFPKAQRVQYRYYMGKYSVYSGEYSEALDALEYAYAHCHKESKQNLRLIAKYLVPLELLRGRLPSSQFLQQYGLWERYGTIVECLRQGNVHQLDSELHQKMTLFLNDGTYFLLEKLILYTQRQLFRLVTQIWQETAQPNEGHIIPITWYIEALALQGVQWDMDQAQCMLANLIQRKLIKGYMHFNKKLVVLSKQEPFPSYSSYQIQDLLVQ